MPTIPSPYTGRFAPSPTGSLHFGSLVTALASYLDAKAHHGRWLVRIEDIDSDRCSREASQHILTILDAYGLHWDGTVVYQQQRTDIYRSALEQLIQQDLAFPCECSRKQLEGKLHHGRCICGAQPDYAWRFLCPVTFHGQPAYHFEDRLQGEWSVHLTDSLDDFVLKRRDGLWAYQLAVVCDDSDQGVTHVVRGIDLIDSTARQGLLFTAFNQATPSYAHLPVSVEANGQKLSKQNLAKALTVDQGAEALFAALVWLKQNPPSELKDSQNDLLEWAIQNWRLDCLRGLKNLPTPALFRQAQ